MEVHVLIPQFVETTLALFLLDRLVLWDKRETNVTSIRTDTLRVFVQTCYVQTHMDILAHDLHSLSYTLSHTVIHLLTKAHTYTHSLTHPQMQHCRSFGFLFQKKRECDWLMTIMVLTFTHAVTRTDQLDVFAHLLHFTGIGLPRGCACDYEYLLCMCVCLNENEVCEYTCVCLHK